MKLGLLFIVLITTTSNAADVPIAPVDAQPLAANVKRVIQAFEFLGHPLKSELIESLQVPLHDQQANDIQRTLDPQVLATVHLNPEYRVKVSRGPKQAVLS